MNRILHNKESERLEFLNELILDASYRQSNNDLLETALIKIAELVGIDFGYIARYLKKEDIIRTIEGTYKVPEGFLEEVKNHRFKSEIITESIKDKVFIISEEEFETPQQKYISRKYNFKTLITIPIEFDNNNSTEIMLLFSHKEKETLLEHIHFLETLGSTLWILIQKQKMYEDYQKSIIRTEKLRALGELAGGIAHDFNNLLTTILGFSQIALTHELNDDIRQYMDIIYKSALDGKKIVERVQNFSRKQFNDKRDVYPINSIVESGIEMARPRWKNFYESYGNKLKIIKGLHSTSKIYCIEHEIREVIINLLSNAMDAMEEGGILTIRTEDIDDKIVVEISDTGIGIPDETIREIFEPFYSTKGTKGTGLGLSIAKEIIEEHKGSIQLKSVVGKGTIFKLYFDRYIEKSESIESPKNDANIDLNIAKNLNVLVVDDIQQVGETVVQMLETIEIHSELETSSENVIHRLSQKEYDIIICDLAMPELNGAELSKIVKEANPKIKFIIATGWPGRFKDKSYKSIDFVLDKPFTIEDLTNAVNSVL